MLLGTGSATTAHYPQCQLAIIVHVYLVSLEVFLYILRRLEDPNPYDLRVSCMCPLSTFISTTAERRHSPQRLTCSITLICCRRSNVSLQSAKFSAHHGQ